MNYSLMPLKRTLTGYLFSILVGVCSAGLIFILFRRKPQTWLLWRYSPSDAASCSIIYIEEGSGTDLINVLRFPTGEPYFEYKKYRFILDKNDEFFVR
jgi:hypothetical protein